jgi:hypothetical protein
MRAELPGGRASGPSSIATWARENRLVRIMCYLMRRPDEPDQVNPTFKTKCPSLRWSTAPPAQCTMNARKMMARMTTTTQKKNTMMPGWHTRLQLSL